MKFLKKLIISVIGIILAFFLIEILLHIFKYEPLSDPELNVNFQFPKNKFIKWAYLDIHEPFFNVDKNVFSIQREDIWIPRDKGIEYYSISKDKNKKRIFILGESVARLYPEFVLEEELLNFFDDVEVINIGMGAYDSYRIEKISRELNKFKPDYVVVCIGNNDGIYSHDYAGCEIDPVDINYLPYKYPLIKKIKSFALFSKLFCHEKKLTKYTIEKNFRQNIIKMIRNLKNTNIIFVDLPNNEYYRDGNIFDNIIQMESKAEYNKHIWKNSVKYSLFIERIKFLKYLREKYDNVNVTNLTDILKKYTNNNLNYNIFYDDCHFSRATYLLLSKILTGFILKKDGIYEKKINLSVKEYDFILKEDNILFLDFEHKGDNYPSSFEKFNIVYKNNKKTFYEYFKKNYEQIKQELSYKKYIVLVLCADILQNNGEIKKSKEILNTLIKLVPDYFEAYLIMGYIEYKNTNFEIADKYFSKVKEFDKDSKIDSAYLKTLKQNN